MGTVSKLDVSNVPGNCLKKDYYLRVIGYCLEIEGKQLFEDLVTALFILCMSEKMAPGGECAKRKQFLDEKIGKFDYEKAYNMKVNANEYKTQKQTSDFLANSTHHID